MTFEASPWIVFTERILRLMLRSLLFEPIGVTLSDRFVEKRDHKRYRFSDHS
jgi:hypothetical protein